MAEDNGVVEKQDETTEKTVSSKAKVADVEDLKFDVSDITAYEVEEFWQSVKDIKVSSICEFMSKYAVKVPEHWGPGDDPATFGTLKMPVFKEARGKFMEALSELVKN